MWISTSKTRPSTMDAGAGVSPMMSIAGESTITMSASSASV